MQARDPWVVIHTSIPYTFVCGVISSDVNRKDMEIHFSPLLLNFRSLQYILQFLLITYWLFEGKMRVDRIQKQQN